VEVAKFYRYARSYEIACDESHKISDFYRVLYRTLGGRCVHRLGDAKPVNRGASYLSRGLSRVRGRSLDDLEITAKIKPGRKAHVTKIGNHLSI
jgi:hypothetical protein